MYREQRRNKIILTILIGILLLMSVGYAAFQSNLNIDGTSNITSNWSIKITNAQLYSTVGSTEEVTDPTFTDLSADFSFNFYDVGDSITYAIEVTNEGTLNASLDSIKIDLTNPDEIGYTIEGIDSGDILEAGKSITFYVTLSYIEESSDITTFEATTVINYVQENNSTNFSDADSSTSESSTLAINGISVDPGEGIIKATVAASNAVKYYYSVDNSKWYESTESTYTLTGLTANTEYTVYVKAEDEDGNVVVSSTTTTTLDNTAPTITITEANGTKEGNNGWYTSVVLTTSIEDNGDIDTVTYCTTTDDSCTSDQTAELSDDNTFTITLEDNTEEQKVCVTATDKGINSEGTANTTTVCSSAYLVDGTEPTVDGVTITPTVVEENAEFTVEIEASDNASGVSTYYFSKDNGEEYVDNDTNSYTFTSLAEGDYMVLVYVEDEAGNVSSVSPATTNITYKNWCNSYGFEDLGDCLIATAAKNETDDWETDITGTADPISSAKTIIDDKGDPDYTKISPDITYTEKVSSTTTTISHSNYDRIGTDYYLDPDTGFYTLKSHSYVAADSITDYDTTDYYTCVSTASTCETMYKINSVDTATDSSGTITYKLNVTTYTQDASSYKTDEVGMYSTIDNDGNNTYYYRGSVGGNYVYFGGYYWRVVRVNGDGSVRLIYDGSTSTGTFANGTSNSNRQISTSAFNVYRVDNAYVGYMYGNVSNFTETNSGTVTFNYTGLSLTTEYWFADDYELDTSTRSYKLSGTTHQGTISSNEVGYYTCFSRSETGTCQRLFYTTSYASSTSMTVSALGYGSTSYSGAHDHVTDSTIKDYLDDWYVSNLSDYDSYISDDAIFCNNMTISSKTSGTYTNDGYGMYPTIYGYERFYNYASQGILGPTLECSATDSYSVSDTYGNGDLEYPIGLITADEVNIAGGMSGFVNNLYYLYTGTTWWTMSPSSFGINFYADGIDINNSGLLYIWAALDASYGVRPVINIDTSTVTFTGTGTAEDPYILEPIS